MAAIAKRTSFFNIFVSVSAGFGYPPGEQITARFLPALFPREQAAGKNAKVKRQGRRETVAAAVTLNPLR